MKLIVKAGGVIPTQNYGNYQPEYSIELDAPDELKPEETEKLLRAMRETVENLYSERDRKFRVIMALKEGSELEPITEAVRPFSIRWYRVDGEIYPSCTSVIHPYGIEFSPEQLEAGWTMQDMDMYALRGTLVHKMMEKYFKEEIILDLAEEEGYKQLVSYSSPVVSVGSLDPKRCNFIGFWRKFSKEFEIESVEAPLFSKELGVAGRRDLHGKYQGLRATMDLKTAASYKKDKLEDYFTQCAGYDLMNGGTDEIYVIWPINPSNKIGYGSPMVTKDVQKYRDRFLDKLKEFRELPNLKEEMERAKKLLTLEDLSGTFGTHIAQTK